MNREVAQPLRARLRPLASARSSAWRWPSKRSRAYGTARPREIMNAQSLACSASSSRTAAGARRARPRPAPRSSAARAANASSATAGPTRSTGRRPCPSCSPPRSLAAIPLHSRRCTTASSRTGSLAAPARRPGARARGPGASTPPRPPRARRYPHTTSGRAARCPARTPPARRRADRRRRVAQARGVRATKSAACSRASASARAWS